MSKDYKITVPAHPNIYQTADREMTIYFNEPEQGVTSDTGILLIIPGFGITAEMDECTKMRNEVSDRYNLVTIQCDYFGQRFMGGIHSPKFDFHIEGLKSVFNEDEFNAMYQNDEINTIKLHEFGSNYPIAMSGFEQLDESIEEFNDMGIMQALDHLNALLVTIEILKDNELEFNAGKIMAYGVGHGAYLSYLCNAFAPQLFHLIIDNSSWLIPKYLSENRLVSYRNGNMTVSVEFDYLAKRIGFDQEILHLPSLYKKIPNSSKILSFHGVNDSLTGSRNKRGFCQSLKGCVFNEITANSVNGDTIKSTDAGLGADLLGFYKYVMDHTQLLFEIYKKPKLINRRIETKQFSYLFDYSTGLPLLTRKSK